MGICGAVCWACNSSHSTGRLQVSFIFKTYFQSEFMEQCFFFFLKMAIFASIQTQLLSGFQLSVVKPKQLLQPITTDRKCAASQSIKINYMPWASAKRGKMHACKSRLVVVLFGSHWLKKWREFCWPIAERSNAKPRQTQFTFDTQLKTGLVHVVWCY